MQYVGAALHTHRFIGCRFSWQNVFANIQLANHVKDIVWWGSPPLPRQDPAGFLLRPPRPQICSRRTRLRPLVWSGLTRCSSTCRRRFGWFKSQRKWQELELESGLLHCDFLWYGCQTGRRLPDFLPFLCVIFGSVFATSPPSGQTPSRCLCFRAITARGQSNAKD